MKEFDAILQRATLSAQDREKLQALIDTYAWLQGELSRKRVSLERVRKILFGTPTTEKTKDVLASGAPAQASENPEPPPGDPPPKPKRLGHGRNGADAYGGAERVKLSHETLSAGGPCPDRGCGGKLYRLPEPRIVVCVTGQPPLEATVYEREALRCGLCGRVFVAALPTGVRDRKYEETTAAMIGLLKYGSGMPFNRLSGLQGNLGVPLAAATQWEIVAGAAETLLPAYRRLLEEAAEGDVVHNDDTTMRILEHYKENRKRREPESEEDGPKKRKRTGTFTSGIVATAGDRRIALFFTGREHAGENLTKVLSARRRDLAAPIQMSDGLERNRPGEGIKTLMANCLAHGRRKFVEVVEAFPAECEGVLVALREVYRHDAATASMSPAERLAYHRRTSGRVMDELKQWLDDQIDGGAIEPNSSLGEAIEYMRKRWEKMTLFLREPGAPLDNNVAERALKKAILHRKNALFFKTERGARVGDLYMSLIHTAELCGVNAFAYLTELQRNAAELRRRPEAWMPWNYAEAMAAAAV